MTLTSCVAELDAAKARLARWTSELARHEKRMKALHPATSQTPVIPAEDAKMVARLNAAVDADETICQADLERAEAAAAAARKEVGRLSCLRIRRGPTGGFCLRRERPNRGGNDCLAPRLAAALVQHAFVGHAVTVLDLGAGIGQYGAFFRSHALASHVNYIALDGAENIEESTRGLVRFADLTDGLPRSIRTLPRVDWVMSLEVAEHVPRSDEARFLHTLTSLPAEGVILSWATPGQAGGSGGAKHVNCQWASYVDCAMGWLGFDYDFDLVAKLGKHTKNFSYPCHWLRPNIMAFRRRPNDDHRHKQLRAGDLPRLRALLGGPMVSLEFEALYRNVTSTRCEHVNGRKACGCMKLTLCPTCSESSPREPRTGRSCPACNECAGLVQPAPLAS